MKTKIYFLFLTIFLASAFVSGYGYNNPTLPKIDSANLVGGSSTYTNTTINNYYNNSYYNVTGNMNYTNVCMVNQSNTWINNIQSFTAPANDGEIKFGVVAYPTEIWQNDITYNLSGSWGLQFIDSGGPTLDAFWDANGGNVYVGKLTSATNIEAPFGAIIAGGKLEGGQLVISGVTDRDSKIGGNLTIYDNGDGGGDVIATNYFGSGKYLTDLPTSGNSSWNETRANLLYANIKWNYNQTTATYDLYNAVWSATYNSTYDATTQQWNGNSTALLGCINNASYLSTYNETYNGLVNNASYLSTYNSTYDATTTQWNGNSTALLACINNASYLSTYNSTYAGLLENSSYLNNNTNHAFTNQTNSFDGVQTMNGTGKGGILITNGTLTSDVGGYYFYARNDKAFGPQSALYLEPSSSTTNRFYVGNSSNKFYSMDFAGVRFFVNVPTELLQTAAADTTYCRARGGTCSVLGNDAADIVLAAGGTSWILPSSGMTSGTNANPFRFMGVVNDTYVNAEKNLFIFDTNSNSSNIATTNHTIWRTKGINIMSLSPTGDLNIFGNLNVTKSTSVNGNLNVVGNLTGNNYYGSLYNFSDAGWAIGIASSGVYYNLTVSTAGEMNGFKVIQAGASGTKLQALVSGYYSVDAVLSADFAGGEYGVGVVTNGADPEVLGRCYTRTTLTGTNGLPITCMKRLNAYDNITMVIDDESTPAKDVTVHAINIKILGA